MLPTAGAKGESTSVFLLGRGAWPMGEEASLYRLRTEVGIRGVEFRDARAFLVDENGLTDLTFSCSKKSSTVLG